jgi:hypothetical protein
MMMAHLPSHIIISWSKWKEAGESEDSGEREMQEEWVTAGSIKEGKKGASIFFAVVPYLLITSWIKHKIQSLGMEIWKSQWNTYR